MAESRFVWHDFVAADIDGAKRFYGELFGWRFQGGDHDYTHIFAGEQGIGGIVGLAAEQKKMGVPAHWLGYVAVDDCDAAVARVTAAGGKVYHREAMETVGKFAVCADPQGAVFSPFQSARPNAPESNDRAARWIFCWDELLTSDPEAAARFYAPVFGWHSERMELGDFGTYTLLKRTGEKDETGVDKNAGGVWKLPPGVPHPFWLAYVAVPSCDAVVDKAQKLGATLTAPPMDIPDVGRFATLLDPQHAPIAVLAPGA